MEEKKLHHFQCTVCGYVYETEEEELPEEVAAAIADSGVDTEMEIEGNTVEIREI